MYSGGDTMPIYEYKCEKCGYKFEKLVKSSERDNNQKCPKCGNNNTKKIFSAFSCGSDSVGSSSASSCGG